MNIIQDAFQEAEHFWIRIGDTLFEWAIFGAVFGFIGAIAMLLKGGSKKDVLSAFWVGIITGFLSPIFVFLYVADSNPEINRMKEEIKNMSDEERKEHIKNFEDEIKKALEEEKKLKEKNEGQK